MTEQSESNDNTNCQGLSNTKPKSKLESHLLYKLLNPRLFDGISEASLAHIQERLDAFLASNDEVYTFDASLTKNERLLLHHCCQIMGISSKSFGGRNNRRVSLYKKSNKVKREIPVVTLSENSKRVLMDLFTHYPPTKDDVGKQKFDELSAQTPSSGKSDDIFCKPELNKAKIEKRVRLLASKMQDVCELKQISQQRAKLPVASIRDVITSTVADHQVVLICGETGCGKTTQVPQYLLDDMWAKGETCKIICTQPRRISAISVAERIARERGEKIGESVGYKIRLDSKGGRHSSILFCTNGVISKMLVSQGYNACKTGETVLSHITHIIVDEIHERDWFADFMLVILRDVLPTNPHLRLVLMSATIDAERFSQYFGGCPIIHIPGFTHPVKTFYMEDVLSILKSPNNNHLNEDCSLNEESRIALDEAIEIANSNEEFGRLRELVFSGGTSRILNYQHSSTGVTPLMVFASKGRVDDICTILSLGADYHLQAHDGSTALDCAEHENQLKAKEIIMEHMKSSLSSVKEQEGLKNSMRTSYLGYINVALIKKLLWKICMETKGGAILVFLPGWEDIMKTHKSLSADPFFQNHSKFRILCLHSMLPVMEQKEVFKRPPQGCRKIIISTNIAETAITIDDVVYIIDSGQIMEKSYDPCNKVSTLQTVWISKASAKQREGRAGRCQPGVCYHLYSRLRAASLPEFQLPEIKRMPIEELCLQAKVFDPNCKIEELLKKTLDPPVPESIENAVTILQEIGALSLNEQLTELGMKLSYLPVHPLIGKMLFFAILLNCLDPALTLACAFDCRSPFILSKESSDKKRAFDAKLGLASIYGGFSDHLAIISAFDSWNSAKSGKKKKNLF